MLYSYSSFIFKLLNIFTFVENNINKMKKLDWFILVILLISPILINYIVLGVSIGATINGSIDGLLEMCPNASQIALVGSSTPMFPEGWKDTRVTALAGSWWPSERKDEIFRIISQGGGIAQLRQIIQHKIAFV